MIMNPTQRLRAALHGAPASLGPLAKDSSPVLPPTPAAVQPPGAGALASLGRATAWLNSPPLTAADLRGNVVLINFWTYTCINWLRTLPYVRAWVEKYRQHGLVVIGVHTPEFNFEHDLDNVRRAIKDLRVNYPIAIDNDYTIWDAFGNRYWPALYVIDAHGHRRHHLFGEGDYEQSERIIQRLLAEMADAMKIGGVSGWLRASALAEAHGERQPAGADLSQDQLATLLDVPVNTLARWERGEVAIRVMLDSWNGERAMVRSMTPFERNHPKQINGSRRARIARGPPAVGAWQSRDTHEVKPWHSSP